MLSMAVLVDQAMWEWRGARWAHLVSDTSYDELHAFAQQIGKRRLGFQGDHYDIDNIDRERALDLGAEPVDARELLARLRGAGLRRRNDKPTWERIAAAEQGRSLTIAQVAQVPAALCAAIVELDTLDKSSRSAVFVDASHAVVLFDWHGDPVEAARLAVDQVWAGEPRVDGERSLELFVERWSTTVRE